MLRRYFQARLLILLLLLLAMIVGCGGDDDAGTNPNNSTVPVLTTATVTAITQTTAQSGGTITSDGGVAVTARGVCWSTNATPTVADSKTTDGTGTGSFTSAITGLTAGTDYYVRAYATNSAGTGYGSAQSFTTTASATVPTITTSVVSWVTQTSVQCGGNVTSDGGSAVIARGVCWTADTLAPSIADDVTLDGSGMGIFASSITGLTDSISYLVRAYATNSYGTGYGNVQYISFPNLPTVYTTPVNAITQTSAQCGGNVTSDGGSTVTARGVCWSTSPTPTVADSRTIDGSGTGGFSSSLTGLTINTTYYVRSYATNIAGTSYDDSETFKTMDSTGTVTDFDGNIYQTVKIGDQWWMAENLKVTHYRNGDTIVSSGPQTGAHYVYDYDLYGLLYNWYAVDDSRNIAPEGWHIPSIAELQILEDYLGGRIVAGGKLKKVGTGSESWTFPNTGATNESGFTALPGGYRNYFDGFKDRWYFGYFWLSESYSQSDGHCFYLGHFLAEVKHWPYRMEHGMSIRCIKD